MRRMQTMKKNGKGLLADKKAVTDMEEAFAWRKLMPQKLEP